MSAQAMVSCSEPRPYTPKTGEVVWGLVNNSWRVVNIISNSFDSVGQQMCRSFEAEWPTADGTKMRAHFIPAKEGNLKPNTQEFRNLLVKTKANYSQDHFAATAGRISPPA